MYVLDANVRPCVRVGISPGVELALILLCEPGVKWKLFLPSLIFWLGEDEGEKLARAPGRLWAISPKAIFCPSLLPSFTKRRDSVIQTGTHTRDFRMRHKKQVCGRHVTYQPN